MGARLIPFLILLLCCGCGSIRPIARQTDENRHKAQINANTGTIRHIGYDRTDWKQVFDSVVVTQSIEFATYDTLGRKVSDGKITTTAHRGTATTMRDTSEVVVCDSIRNETTIRQEDYTKKKTDRGFGFLDKIIILAVIVLTIYTIRLFRRD